MFETPKIWKQFWQADAQYSLDGTILSLFPVFGNGPMYLELGGLDVTAFAALTLSQEGYIQVAFSRDMFLPMF
jgi:hypothetical protein